MLELVIAYLPTANLEQPQKLNHWRADHSNRHWVPALTLGCIEVNPLHETKIVAINQTPHPTKWQDITRQLQTEI